MKKAGKNLSPLLAVCLLFCLMSGTALADGEVAYAVEGGNIYFDTTTGEITGADETVTAADIPAAIGETAVTAIGYRAFVSSPIASVTLPEGLTTIKGYAFADCHNLTQVDIPDSVEEILIGAFGWCTSLQSISVSEHNQKYCIVDGVLYSKDMTQVVCVPGGRAEEYTVPDSVEDMGLSLWGCTSLPAIHVGEGNPYYSSIDGVLYSKDKKAVYCCPGGRDTAYIIPDGVEAIEDAAFAGCGKLPGVTIPDSVTYIGFSAFENCTSLTSITIPAGCCEDLPLGGYYSALYGCTGLTEINFSGENERYCSVDGVVYNKDKTLLALYPAGRAGSVVIPDGVKIIGPTAFSGSAGLTDVTIPDGVTDIYYDAFWNCTGLAHITIPKSVTYIDAGAFDSCPALTEISYGGTAAQWAKIEIEEYNEVLDSVSITFRETDLLSASVSAAYTGSAVTASLSFDWCDGEADIFVGVYQDGRMLRIGAAKVLEDAAAASLTIQAPGLSGEYEVKAFFLDPATRTPVAECASTTLTV